MSKLVGYGFEITYRAGKSNSAADALSRIPVSQLFPLSTFSFDFIQQLRDANKKDLELLALQQQILTTSESIPGFIFREGLVFFKDCLVVPTDSPIHSQLLHEFHSSLVGGHSGLQGHSTSYLLIFIGVR